MPKKAKQAASTPNEPYNRINDYCNDVSFICAVRVFDSENPGDSKNCAAKPAQIDSCHTLQDGEAILFQLIDEKELSQAFDKKMEKFVEILNSELKKNEDMKQKIKRLYGFESDDDILCAVSERGKNETVCNDITGFVSLNTPDKDLLFHISIHPKAPKYYKKPGTRTASCGYYSKSSEGSQGTGAFHYKIERLANRTTTSFKNKPYKKFKTADDSPGNFIEDEEDFVVSDDRLKPNAPVDLHKLHNFFYNKFIEFWNKTIVKDDTFRRPGQPAPEQLVPAPAVPEQSIPEAPVARAPSKRASQDPSEATEDPQPSRKSSKTDQSVEETGAGKRIRRKTIKKRKINKKRKTKKRKTIKRKTSKR
jgi:hypothetical protein